MKKLLFVLLSIIAIAFNAQARRAFRGSLEGVTAEDLRANAPATQTARYPARAKAYNTCDIQVLPILEGKKFTPKSYTTQFGQNWAAIGGGIRVTDFDIIKPCGAVCQIEGSINVISASNDTYGLNLFVPLIVAYTKVPVLKGLHQDPDKQLTLESYISVYARPYYRFNILDNVVITPFADFGIGGEYFYYEEGKAQYPNIELSYFGALGIGVEISLYKDFSFTPRYSWIHSSESGIMHNIDVEFAWRFASNMTAIAEYSCIIEREVELNYHTTSIKLRFEF